MGFVKRFRPSPAMVVACLALLVSLAGTSVAAVSQLAPRDSVATSSIRRGAVSTPKLRNGAVSTPKLRNGAVSTPKLRNGAVATSKLRRGAVTTAKLRNFAVGRIKLARGAVDSSKVANGSLLAADFAPGQLPSGPPGPKGEKGEKGDTGIAAVVVRRSDEYTTQGGGAGAMRANCEAGEVALGGGVGLTSGATTSALTIHNSQPFPNTTGATPTGWGGGYAWTAPGLTVAVYVVCARLNP